ncbi:hypothetical protein GF420_11340 [candidate division GN15 bacterium]|nr:hypothetical protein [candidate division GN15 bacterium]
MDDEFPDLNSYYFTHTAAGCGTTFGIEVEKFEKFITEPIPSEIKAGGAGCHGHCTSINDLEECHNECRYAPYRRLLLRMLEKLKTDARSGDGAR